jgi:molybdenum cofactor cytidylyltransferase
LSTEIKYGIIILAAGNSSRLGEPKQLLSYQNSSLIRNVVEQSLAIPETIVMVVTGASAELVEHELADKKILVARNAEWSTGMASSIKTAVTQILRLYPSLDALLITVCDQPFLKSNTLNVLIAEYNKTGKNIIASAYNNTVGTPVLFSKKYFTDLQKLQGQEGAKKIILNHPEDVSSISFPSGEIDIDTRDDYNKLLGNNKT